MNMSFFAARSGNADGGNAAVSIRVVFACQLLGNQGGFLMDFEHVINMVCGCHDHFFILGQDQSLQHVHSLSQVGHLNPAAVGVKNVECKAGD